MGALKFFFLSPEVPIWSKFQLYKAVPLNLAFWCCELWMNSKTCVQVINAFHCRSIRSILQNNISQVRVQCITNHEIQQHFHKIPFLWNIMLQHQLNFLGRITCMSSEKLPVKILSAHIRGFCQRGRPKKSTQRAFINALQILFPSLPPDDRFKTWVPFSQKESKWKTMILFICNMPESFDPSQVPDWGSSPATEPEPDNSKTQHNRHQH